MKDAQEGLSSECSKEIESIISRIEGGMGQILKSETDLLRELIIDEKNNAISLMRPEETLPDVPKANFNSSIPSEGSRATNDMESSSAELQWRTQSATENHDDKAAADGGGDDVKSFVDEAVEGEKIQNATSGGIGRGEFMDNTNDVTDEAEEQAGIGKDAPGVNDDTKDASATKETTMNEHTVTLDRSKHRGASDYTTPKHEGTQP